MLQMLLALVNCSHRNQLRHSEHDRTGPPGGCDGNEFEATEQILLDSILQLIFDKMLLIQCTAVQCSV